MWLASARANFNIVGEACLDTLASMNDGVIGSNAYPHGRVECPCNLVVLF